jgi:hypothetical protein
MPHVIRGTLAALAVLGAAAVVGLAVAPAPRLPADGAGVDVWRALCRS